MRLLRILVACLTIGVFTFEAGGDVHAGNPCNPNIQNC